MPETLLAKHALTDRVAYGDAGERNVADLLRDAGAVAHALPLPTQDRPRVLVGIRRDPYAAAAALLGAWARGFVVAVPPPDVTRDGFLRLAQHSDVAAVIHDTASTAALPIARVLEQASAEHRLRDTGFVREASVLFHPPELDSARPAYTVTARQLVREASAVGTRLGLPEHKTYACSVLPETRYGLAVGLLWPLLCGGAFLRDDPRAPTWHIALSQQSFFPPVLVSTPAHLRALSLAREQPLRHAAIIVSGGAPLTTAAFRVLRRTGVRVYDVYANAPDGCSGYRMDEVRPFHPLLDVSMGTLTSAGVEVSGRHTSEPSGVTLHAAGVNPSGFVPTGASVRRAELEQRVAWIDGVYDAALLPGPDAPGETPSWNVALCLDADAPALQVLRARIASEVPDLRICELRCVQRQSSLPPTFSVGAPDLRRNGSAQHDRVGVRRLFDLARDGTTPLAWELPVVRETRADSGCTREVRVPRHYGYFEGHFPGYPLVPGAAQLSAMVLPWVRSARPELGRLIKMARLKFQERIVPEDTIEVSLSFAADPGCVDFSLRRGETLCASGRLWFERSSSDEVTVSHE